MVWVNGRLAVFHGTTLKSANAMLTPGAIDPGKGRPRLDFGKGFYVTTNLRQAKNWANKRSRVLAAAGTPDSAAVLQMDVDRDQLALEEDLVFVVHESSADFWDFIFHNREGDLPHRPVLGTNYSVVYGPVTYYPQYEIVHDADQICFTTRRAAKLLENAAIVEQGTPLIRIR
jgi:hypothetical protein